MVQDAAVSCNCPNCGASLVIFPSSVLGQVGEKTGNVEAELDFEGALAESRDGTERRYPVAGVDGGFTCPACQTQEPYSFDSTCFRVLQSLPTTEEAR